MKYLLFTNPATGSPILTKIIKTEPPEVVITTLCNFDSWKRIILRLITNKFTVEDKLRFLYRIKFYDYRCLNSKKLKQIIEENHIELAYITTFSYIIPRDFINLFPKGIYNFHPSLLPKHGGANPFFWIIYSDEKYTGTTCHRVTEVIDHGKILLQKKYPVNKMDARELFNCYVKDIAEMIPVIISNYLQLASEAGDMEITEYDPPNVPDIDFCADNNDREHQLRYKRARRRLV